MKLTIKKPAATYNSGIFKMKQEILEAMKTLIQEGESLTTETYTGENPSAFKEFAEVNGFDLDEVIDVYKETVDELDALWNEINKHGRAYQNR